MAHGEGAAQIPLLLCRDSSEETVAFAARDIVTFPVFNVVLSEKKSSFQPTNHPVLLGNVEHLISIR